MFPINMFVSERRASEPAQTGLQAQRRLLPTLPWRICDSVQQLRVFQRYLCKDCDRTFNDQLLAERADEIDESSLQ
jgi:transposase